ncbi:DUF1540 domain-containing protein [Oxalobacter paraformigenes]|uniref:DUF1540 domain-containing protein n=1 Tax=Oxalobacter paraformigenes TaxID=556268 RepID=C3X210_9BURK|nr:DUF1540 domain-containing protein [Oxalobacter paraformigenes]EEO27246.1 hypothetical protein OFAG_00399 [Oxalobacter paraformigenes]
MKHIQIIMPEVRECSAQSCGFNKNLGCHARAITVGDGQNPGCDTFFAVSDPAGHAKSVGRTSGVGACKVADCKYNEDYECMADEIVVAFSNSKANCQTYVHR